MKHIPDASTVKQVLCPGLWIDHQGTMHFCAETYCEALGYPPTKVNIETAEAMLKEVVLEETPEAMFITEWKEPK